MRHFIYGLLWSCLFAACSLGADEALVLPVPAVHRATAAVPVTGPLRLNDLRVGQVARYRYFTGTGFPTHTNTRLAPGADTLCVQVVAEDDRGFRVIEYLEEGSPALRGSGDLVSPDSVFSYYLQPDDAALHVLPRHDGLLRSRLFGFRHQEFPALPLAAAGPDVTGGWAGAWCACRKSARAEYVRIGKMVYQKAHLLLDNRRTQTDGLGFLLHYLPSATFVRSGFYDPTTNQTYGWELLAR